MNPHANNAYSSFGTRCLPVGRHIDVFVIVGHGPSIVEKRLGSWLDAQTVVRLKRCPRPDPEVFGTRTDFHFVPTLAYMDHPTGAKVWAFMHAGYYPGAQNADRERWYEYYHSFNPRHFKPSSGLRAIMCAVQFLDAKEIGVLGFDAFMDHKKSTRQWTWDPVKEYISLHDYETEHKIAESLVKLVEV